MGCCMSTTVIVLLCSILANIIFSVFSFIIQVVLIVQNFLPTDPFGGLLDIAKEPFFAYMPYVNYFVPVGFCVALVSAFVSAYATYVIFKYFKKIISSVLGSKSILVILSNIIK